MPLLVSRLDLGAQQEGGGGRGDDDLQARPGARGLLLLLACLSVGSTQGVSREKMIAASHLSLWAEWTLARGSAAALKLSRPAGPGVGAG